MLKKYISRREINIARREINIARREMNIARREIYYIVLLMKNMRRVENFESRKEELLLHIFSLSVPFIGVFSA